MLRAGRTLSREEIASLMEFRTLVFEAFTDRMLAHFTGVHLAEPRAILERAGLLGGSRTVGRPPAITPRPDPSGCAPRPESR